MSDKAQLAALGVHLTQQQPLGVVYRAEGKRLAVAEVEAATIGSKVYTAAELQAMAAEWEELRRPETAEEAREAAQAETRIAARRELVRAALLDEREGNERWKERGYLFPSEVGTKLLQSNVRRLFKEKLEAAGLPDRIRVHDLRHTAATNYIAAGVDIPTVQYITGHKDSKVLLEIYAHHQDDRNAAALEKVEQRRKRGKG